MSHSQEKFSQTSYFEIHFDWRNIKPESTCEVQLHVVQLKLTESPAFVFLVQFCTEVLRLMKKVDTLAPSSLAPLKDFCATL